MTQIFCLKVDPYPREDVVEVQGHKSKVKVKCGNNVCSLIPGNEVRSQGHQGQGQMSNLNVINQGHQNQSHCKKRRLEMEVTKVKVNGQFKGQGDHEKGQIC